MAESPQPVRVRWSPGTLPLDPPDYVNLGAATRIRSVSTNRGRGTNALEEYGPGTASIELAYTDDAGAPVPDLDLIFRRSVIEADFGGGYRPLFTGFLKSLVPNADALPSGPILATGTMVDALGLWGYETLTRVNDSDDDGPVDPGFVGWSTNVTALAFEVDLSSLFIGFFDLFGVINAPVVLPAQVTTDAGITYHRWSENALTALAKALDVELGAFFIAADGTPAINGRYTIPAVLAAGGSSLVFGPDDGPVGNPDNVTYLKRTLRFTDGFDSYRNTARTSGLDNRVRTASLDTPDGLPTLAIDYLDLWCKSAPWVLANANLLRDLYAGVSTAFPSELAVTVWTAAGGLVVHPTLGSLGDLLADASDYLGRTLGSVLVAHPDGSGAAEFFVTIDGIAWQITPTAITATVRFGRALARWLSAFGGAGIFSLDDPDRGLDSDAILGP